MAEGEQTTQVKPPRARRFRLAAGVTLLSLLLAELVLHFTLGNFDVAPFVRNPGDGRCVGLQPSTASTYTGTVARIPPVVHAVNEYGYRGPALPRERAPGTLRIAALGDSFTFGQGVTAAEALPAQLEVHLRGATKSPDVEVLNFGVPGLNLRESIDQYRYFARGWQPDVVVLFLFKNDLEMPLCDLADRRLFMTTFRHLRLFRLGVVALAPESFGTPRAHSTPERVQRLDQELAELQLLVKADGARLLLVSLADPLADAVATRAGAAKLAIPAFVFEREEFEALEIIPGESHWTPAANAAVGAQIAAWMGPRL